MLPDPSQSNVEQQLVAEVERYLAAIGHPAVFDPLRTSEATQTGIASLFGLQEGWYKAIDIAEVLASELPLTAKWLVNALRWASRGGALRWRRGGRVYVDPTRMSRAWPDFDPDPYLWVPLNLQPVDTARRPT